MQRKLTVGVLGATGLVGRAACKAIASNPRMRLGSLVGSKMSDNQLFREVWERKEADLVAHYGAELWTPMAYPEVLGNARTVDFSAMLEGDDDYVLSVVPLRAGDMEDELLRRGKVVMSASPYRRFEPDVKLIVSEANGHRLTASDRYIKSPNCCSNGICVGIAPLHERYGVKELVVTTYQSISGRGDLKYPKHLVHCNVYPLSGTEERTDEYIKKEIKKVFSENFAVSVSCQRVHTQKNHFIDVRMRTHVKPKSREEVVELLRNFSPLAGLTEGGYITHGTTTPIVVKEGPGMPRPIKKSAQEDADLGMRVIVGNIQTDDDVFDIRLSVLVDNIDRGAYGGLLQTADILFNYHRGMHSNKVASEEVTSTVSA